jgi:rubredoxin
MRHAFRFNINFTGGIISPGSMLNILYALERAGIQEIRFGLRQQLLIDVSLKDHDKVAAALHIHDVFYEVNKEEFPNILSSYPAEEIFIKDSWVKEGVYKDIFDQFDYKPGLKINISDGGQTFTPFFTGHINWIASKNQHYWYLYIRFPKSHTLILWKELVYTNEIPRVSKHLEEMIKNHAGKYFKNNEWSGHLVYEDLKKDLNILSSPADKPLELPQFKLPYYEGYNSYGSKSWLGLYQRNELFTVAFLKDICLICLETKIGQFYSTPWKSLIIKNIEEKHRSRWSYALNNHRINVRHASNELNWQVEDTNEEGLTIKQAIIRQFDKEDVRTFGLCIAVNIQPHSGLFGSVILKKQYAEIRGKLKPLEKFDIFHTEDFNPNSKNYTLYRTGVQKGYLPQYLVSLCKSYYEKTCAREVMEEAQYKPEQEKVIEIQEIILYQCSHCHTVYDEETGEPGSNIPAGTPFLRLPSTYNCPLCDSEKTQYSPITRSKLLAC